MNGGSQAKIVYIIQYKTDKTVSSREEEEKEDKKGG